MKISFKKNLFLFFVAFLISQILHASEGIVIVLEAPLLKKPQWDSVVLQTLRKGARVFVSDQSLIDKNSAEFILTFDRAGNPAYIPLRYVKIITGTEEEKETPIVISPFDPTDYRLEEPIPVTYPFEKNEFLRASVSATLGNTTKSPYAYSALFNKQTYGLETGVKFLVTKKVSFDRYDRFYFGFIGLVTTSKNKLHFKNDNFSEESRDRLRLGPWLTYDAFKNELYRLTLGSGFTYNYQSTTLKSEGPSGIEERLFRGFSLTPVISSNFQISNVLPSTDFLLGMDINFFLPYTLKADGPAEIPELWGESEQITSSFKAQASLFLGIQVRY